MKKHLAIIAVALIAIVAIVWNGNGGSGTSGGTAGPVNVRVGVAHFQALASELRTPGTTESLMDVDITAERAGRVERIHFSPNQAVSEGELLVELDASEQQAALQEARVTLAEDRRLLRHYETLITTRAIPQTDVDAQQARVAAGEARVAAAEAVLAKLHIRAPFSGVLGFRLISPGTLIQPGDMITTLDAIDTLKLEFSAPESWLGRIKPGDTLSAVSVAHPGKVFEAEVNAVATRVDPDTRALVFKALIDNSEHLLKPGMSMTVTLRGPAREALVIPEESLLQEGNARFVYLITADQTVERRDVEVGVRKEGQVEILSGLNEGDRLVREGVQNVRPGSRVAVVPDRVAS